MATGGGNPGPPHGSSLSLSSSILTNSTSSKSDSLQTPDTSTLFISSLSNIDTSAPPLPSVDPDFSSSNSPQPFSSLEELLNVTGINSPDLGTGSGSSGGGGVYSLQQLAKEVDSEQQQGSFELQPPPPKKLHLDPSVSLSSSQPQIQQEPLPSNIRVQSLTSVPSQPPDKPTTSQAPWKNNIIASNIVSSTQSDPISLQLSNSQPSSITNAVTSTPLLSQYSTHQTSVGLLSHSSTLPSVTCSGTSSALVGSGTSSTFAVLPQSSQAQFQSNSISSASIFNVSSAQHQQTSLHSESVPPLQSTQGQPPIINPTTLPPPVNAPMNAQSVSNVPSLTSSLPSRMQAPSVTTSSSVPPPASAAQNPLLKLIMLYKNCQMLGDEEGMARLKQQFIQQATRTQILAQQTPKHLAQTTLPTLNQASNSSSNFSGNAPIRTSGASSSQPLSKVNLTPPSNHLLRVPSPPVAGTTTSMMSSKQQQMPSGNQFVMSQQQQQAPQISTSLSRATNSGAMSSTHLTGSWITSASNSLPSVLGQSSSSTSVNPILSVPGQRSSQGTLQEQGNVATAAQQRVIKQLQSLMATLSESQRPKNVNELREFIQKYGAILSSGSKVGPPPQPTKQTPPSNHPDLSTSSSTLFPDSNTRSQVAVPSLLGSNKTESTHTSMQALSTMTASSIGVLPSSRSKTNDPLSSQALTTPFGGSVSAQVAEHFKTSLLGLQPPSSTKTQVLPTLSSSSQVSIASVSSSMPIIISDSPSAERMTPPLSLTRTTITQSPVGSVQTAPTMPMTVHAPVTSQFQQPSSSGVQSNKMLNAKSSSTPQGIQPGVPTPLPPGLTLETLGVLCRLPDTELVKLKIPAALLSAIRVWKARQVPLNKTSAKQTSANTTRNNIPVVTASSGDVTAAAGGSSSIVTFGANGNVFGQNMKVGDALKASSSLCSNSSGSVMKTDIGNNKTVMGQQQQPLVIPSSAGFPPRSLHAYIPMVPQAQQQLRNTASSSTGTRNTSQHMTRFRTKMEQQKADTDRIQALTRALQSSEEARIAFRFSAHLEKMHSQLLSPDTLTPFHSYHDVLARLLPYHIYAEPEPPPAAVEKADAVFESVAQVLLSRSRGLMSRFQQIATKTEAQGGPELMCMQMQLERLFQEGEQERIKQENIEKQQAEQVAADLSLMADGMDSFDADFSLGDAFFPVLEMDAGIT